MRRNSVAWRIWAAGVALLLLATQLAAQGVATSAIRGTVRSDDNLPLEASVTIRNLATGVVSTTRVRGGRYLLQGLETGGPYVIEVRHLGFVSQRSAPTALSLGNSAEVDFILKRVPVSLDTVTVLTKRADLLRAGGGGTATTIEDDLLHRLPTLNRNVFDFLPVAPQLSTKVGAGRTGLSAAGANLRFNNFLINGVDERLVNGNVSSGINGGKSIPVDAVKEYQIVVAPYDVRYGDFTGALVNTVTRSGTNELTGSAFSYWRSDRLGRQQDDSTGQPYERLQTGFSFGGPVRRNRIHFFVAPEVQRLTSPAPGAYLGQPETSAAKLRIDPADISRFEEVMKKYGLIPGSAGVVTNKSNLLNVFIRVDAAIPEWNSRIIAFTSSGFSDDSRFTRTSLDSFSLSTYRFSTASHGRLTSVQLHTDLPWLPGSHNELLMSHLTDGQDFLPDVKQPLIRVTLPAVDGGVITLSSGTAESAQGRFSDNRSFSVKDELSFSVYRTSEIVVGAQVENFRIHRGGVTGGYGVWTFSNLDSLARGRAERYELRQDLGGAGAPLNGWQYAAYFGNHWTPAPQLELTGGVRADALSFSSRPSYNAAVDSMFGRR
ncbi:MAG TPA: carboxypeptidase regulatory-like domain-containing protein, partial [Gemmatimonadaceae bacterium]|nr:carboxypeptidase regulatory-like domain-containing protein [Gemmatimonadaceae bacterium]